MPAVPTPVQNVLDKVDAQIQKERSPLVNVILASPVFLIVSLPIAFLVGAISMILVGTDAPMVAQSAESILGIDPVWVGIGVGVFTMLFFWAWAAYGTYTTSKR